MCGNGCRDSGRISPPRRRPIFSVCICCAVSVYIRDRPVARGVRFLIRWICVARFRCRRSAHPHGDMQLLIPTSVILDTPSGFDLTLVSGARKFRASYFFYSTRAADDSGVSIFLAGVRSGIRRRFLTNSAESVAPWYFPIEAALRSDFVGWVGGPIWYRLGPHT